MSQDQSVSVRMVDAQERNPDAMEALAFVSTPQNGAEALFVGSVRDERHARRVEAISYDAYEPLCLAMFEAICAEAKNAFGPDLRLYVSHARGRVSAGQSSIVIAVGSPHREAAFAGCRYVIDEIKKRAPIWKLEHFADGGDVWAEGTPLA